LAVWTAGWAFGTSAWSPQEAVQAQEAGGRPSYAQDLSVAFREVAKTIRPSVVSISSVTRAESGGAGGAGGGAGLPPELRQFFGDEEFERFFEFRGPRDQEQRGLGSGVVVSADGYVLTNFHVVGEADQVDVRLSDGREFRAKIVGGDKSTDIAVLKIDANNLSPARLGDSDALEAGEWVLAMGSPFGLNQTLTAGIISATGRKNVGITDYEDFVQTDAAINPGNSGGPLVNLKGEVIGINTAIASRSGGSMGVGFAIPSNMARQIMDEILQNGKVVRGYLGAMIQDLNADLAQSFGYDSTEGVLIGDVAPGGPGQQAGLKAGDIVASYNGKPLKDANDLRNRVAATDPGSQATLEVFRDGRKQRLAVEIGTLDSQAAAAAPRGEDPVVLGLAVQDLTPELAAQIGVEADLRGAVVTKVEPGSLAADAGLRPGDMVVAVGDVAVGTAAEFRAAVKSRDAKQGLRLQVLREGLKRFVFLKASE
jgi:serine protease Do